MMPRVKSFTAILHVVSPFDETFSLERFISHFDLRALKSRGWELNPHSGDITRKFTFFLK